jgi:hypothetical protein
VAAAAQHTSETSFRFETRLVSGDTDIRAEGAVAAGAESAVVRATTPLPDLAVEGDGGDLEVRLDGDTVYVSIGSVLGPGLRPEGAEWLALDLRDGGYADRLLQSVLERVRDLDPTQALDRLEEADNEVVEDGSEEVRGEPTTRYRFGADVDADVDVAGRAWVDGEGRLRRLELSEGGTTATVDLFDFGTEVDVEPPPAAETTTVDRWLREGLGG